jgi:hypothetical protein
MDLPPFSEVCRSLGVVEGFLGTPPGPVLSGRSSGQSMTFMGRDSHVAAEGDRLRFELQCHQVERTFGNATEGFRPFWSEGIFRDALTHLDSGNGSRLVPSPVRVLVHYGRPRFRVCRILTRQRNRFGGCFGWRNQDFG